MTCLTTRSQAQTWMVTLTVLDLFSLVLPLNTRRVRFTFSRSCTLFHPAVTTPCLVMSFPSWNTKWMLHPSLCVSLTGTLKDPRLVMSLLCHPFPMPPHGTCLPLQLHLSLFFVVPGTYQVFYFSRFPPGHVFSAQALSPF